MTNLYDTITAISTPLGTGGVGIIRLSGNDCTKIIEEIFSKNPNEQIPTTLKPLKIHHGWIVENKQPIDEVVVLYFKAPHSYTGEDIVEIHCHGGLNVVRKILNLTISKGARLAERGEFTKRAFLNQKLDLSQAEAVLDLIHSKTDIFSGLSANNLSGRLSQYISEIKKETFDLLSKITAAIDFPEDVAEPPYEFIKTELERIIKKLNKAISTFSNSNMMRQGIKVAIVGKPNAGKSSLFNSLLDINRAIVTDIAGTTRDAIEETIDIAGVPTTLIDTAGIRELDNISDETYVESIGIDISKKYIENSDIVIFVYDLTQGMQEEDKKIYQEILNKTYITAASKADLTENLPTDKNTVAFSSVTKAGIDELKKKIEEKILNKNETENCDFSINIRQHECLKSAYNSLNIALDATQREELQDLISIDIKSALIALDEITGEVITDDILNNIFDNFCIGK